MFFLERRDLITNVESEIYFLSITKPKRKIRKHFIVKYLRIFSSLPRWELLEPVMVLLAEIQVVTK